MKIKCIAIGKTKNQELISIIRRDETSFCNK